MFIDFSKPIDLSHLNSNIDWQNQIILFINNWIDEDSFITVKTSGSTGKPKTIELSKTKMIESALATGSFLGFKENQTALLCLPASYIAGKMMLVRAMQYKMKLYLLEPKSLVKFNFKVDFAAMTPMQCNYSLDSIKNISQLIVGGASISNVLKEKLNQIPNSIYETYGMTETISHIALKNIKQSDFFECLPNVSISKDNRGCLQIHAPRISDEVLITNDRVEIIENSFQWLGRLDFIINSGGVKISPEILEKKLQSFIPFPIMISSEKDAVLGDKIILIIENEEPTNDIWNDIEKSNLNKIENPKAIYWIKSFERTDNGKLKRIEILKKVLKK